MKKRLVSLFLALAIVLGLMPLIVPDVQAAQTPAHSSNINDQSYSRYAAPVYSTLAANGEGYTRIEYISGTVFVEQYDAAFQFLSSQEITAELSLFGGAYVGTDYNFLVFGQNNSTESDETEVVRVVRYTKNWERVDAASLYGANTTIPFRSGSLRLVQCGNMLYIRTSHQMYTNADDGLRHQANLTMSVRISDMTITDQYSKVMNVKYGYVSHSFNQFIQVDGTDLLAVDHGDAYPRSVVLIKYRQPAGQDTFTGYCDSVDVLPITGDIGNNYTGVSVGGFEISESAYLVAGNSVAQVEGANFSGQRNIFVTATSKSEFSADGTTLRYLTSYTDEDSVTVSTPQLIKISDSQFFIAWMENGSLCYAFLNANGELSGQIYRAGGSLSDCKPILAGNSIMWYVTSNSAPTFYQISLNNPGQVTQHHSHLYSYTLTTVPTETIQGALLGRCQLCDHTTTVVLPSINAEVYTYELLTAPTCTVPGQGRYTWNNTAYGTITFEVEIPATGHSYTSITTPPSCTQQGYTTYTCTACGHSYVNDYVGATGHTFTNWVTAREPTHRMEGEEVSTCHCGAKSSRAIAKLPNPFTDVPDGKYYTEAILWALDEEITAGLTVTQFGTYESCNRAQVVSFLWRIAGCPEPTSTVNPFTDVSSKNYYYKAVLWAVENGIAYGKADSKFAPNDAVNRAEFVTFLWRTEGSPKPQKRETNFTDVKPGMYYSDAIAWAVENGLASGLTETLFGTHAPCIRAQVVTFLFRAYEAT